MIFTSILLQEKDLLFHSTIYQYCCAVLHVNSTKVSLSIKTHGCNNLPRHSSNEVLGLHIWEIPKTKLQNLS